MTQKNLFFLHKTVDDSSIYAIMKYKLEMRSKNMETNYLEPVYTVTFAGRRKACKAWIERHGIGEIYPDYDGCWQVRVFLS